MRVVADRREFIRNKSFDAVVRRQVQEVPAWVSRLDAATPPQLFEEFELDIDDSKGVWTLVGWARLIAAGHRTAS